MSRYKPFLFIPLFAVGLIFVPGSLLAQDEPLAAEAPPEVETLDAPAPPTSPSVMPAEKGLIDIFPVSQAQERGVNYDSETISHPAISIAPDRSELVRLDGDAASIIVGNPQHLSVVADSPRTLVLIPKAPGATFFTVLDRDGKVLMQRHVLIATPKEKYVRIRKTCTNSSNDDCKTTNVYYCPDTCHPILLDDAQSTESSQTPEAPDDDMMFDFDPGDVSALPEGQEP